MRERDEVDIRLAAEWYLAGPQTYTWSSGEKQAHIRDGSKLMFSLLKLLGLHWSEADALLKELREDARRQD